MRTTITLDTDVVALVKELMRERDLTFKEAVNHGLRLGLGAQARSNRRHRTPTFRMGSAAVSLDKALQLAGQLEDEELVRRLSVRK